MNPKVIELENLSLTLKKALRAYRHLPGVQDGPALAELIDKAKESGISVRRNASLQELLAQTQALLQAEILCEFDRRVYQLKRGPYRHSNKKHMVKNSISQMELELPLIGVKQDK